MRFLNKIIVILGLLVALPAVTAVLVFPDLSLQTVGQVVEWLQPQVVALSSQQRMTMMAAAIGVDLLLVILLYLEVRRPPAHQAPVSRAGGGVAEITVDAIARRLEYEIGSLAEVMKAAAHVDVQRRRVRVGMDIVTSPHTNLPEKINEIAASIRRTVETEMGLRLAGKPEVRIQYAAYQATPPRAAVSEAKTPSIQPPSG